MRVFVSYASEDRDIAEAVVHSLRGRRHDVFFDRNDLPPGGSYEDRIEAAIRASNVLIFLISHYSIAPGRFTLTELAMAERHWPHADGKVLPVRINSDEVVPIDAIPAYLRSVTILEPAGNVAAETAIAVSALATPWLRGPSLVGGAVAIALTAAVALYVLSTPTGVAVTVLPPASLDPGYLDVPATVLLRYKVVNKGPTAAKLQGLKPISEPPSALTLWHTYDPKDVGPELLLPNEVKGNQFWASLAPDAPDTFSYQICANVVSSGLSCSAASKWTLASGIRSSGESAWAFRLPSEIAKGATAVVRDGNSFVLATQSPAKMHRISSSGEIIATAELPAEPVALSSGPHGLLVGTEGPELLLRFDADLAETARRDIELPSSVKVTFDGPVATKPISIAQDADRIAVITGDEAAASALLFVSPDLKDQKLPSYFAEIASDLRDMRVSAATTHSGFWGYKTNTLPASLYEFDTDRFRVFSGRDHDLVACASDVVVVADGLVIPNCDGDVVKIDTKDNRLSETSRFGRPRGFSAAASSRSTVRLFELEDALVAAIKKVSAGDESNQETHLSVLGNSNAHLPIKPFNATVVDLATLPDVGLVIFANPEGQRDTVALPF